MLLFSKMDMSVTKKPKTMAELLPGLSGILSENSMQTLTAKKQPRTTMLHTRTTEKVMRPMTIAEMKANILALKVESPRRAPPDASAKKKHWNSSVKVESKKISHTAGGQGKFNQVRKVLNFQPKPKIAPNPRMTVSSETPKFPKPEFRAKKSVQVQAKSNVRISGVYNMPETPVLKPVKTRMTLAANKENQPNRPMIYKKPLITPKPVIHKKYIAPIPDTPLSNESWKSSCDASFLQKEKEIHEMEEKINAVTEEPTLERISEISPPVSTPFKEYRNVNDFFNNTNDIDNCSANDNTIMCFDKPTISNDGNKREESVIVSLCDLLNKASVSNNNTNRTSTELEDLLEVEKQTEQNIKMIESGIHTLNNIKESQLKSLLSVRKLINEKRNTKTNSESDMDKTLIEETKDDAKEIKQEKISPEKSPVLGRPCSVIKSCSKSPSYKIPKKNLCLRKKMFHKSMPNVSNGMQTPPKEANTKALSMYMKMKEQMNFLNTPVVKHRNLEVPDTPAVTSHNLQMQLDKLFSGS